MTGTPHEFAMVSAADVQAFVDRLAVHFVAPSAGFVADLLLELQAERVTAEEMERAAASLIRHQRSVHFPRVGRILQVIEDARRSARKPLVYVAAPSIEFERWIAHLAARGDWLAFGKTGVTMTISSFTASKTSRMVGRIISASGTPIGSALAAGRRSIWRTMS